MKLAGTSLFEAFGNMMDDKKNEKDINKTETPEEVKSIPVPPPVETMRNIPKRSGKRQTFKNELFSNCLSGLSLDKDVIMILLLVLNVFLLFLILTKMNNNNNNIRVPIETAARAGIVNFGFN